MHVRMHLINTCLLLAVEITPNALSLLNIWSNSTAQSIICKVNQDNHLCILTKPKLLQKYVK